MVYKRFRNCRLPPKFSAMLKASDKTRMGKERLSWLQEGIKKQSLDLLQGHVALVTVNCKLAQIYEHLISYPLPIRKTKLLVTERTYKGIKSLSHRQFASIHYISSPKPCLNVPSGILQITTLGGFRNSNSTKSKQLDRA